MRDFGPKLPHHQVVRLDIIAEVFELLMLTAILLIRSIGSAFLLIDLIFGMIQLRARKLPQFHFLPLCHMLDYTLNVV
jgi:hypothetical protein